MPNYNQAQFPRHLEILVTNGKLAEVQAIIGPIGYDAAALEAGQALLQSWLELANGAKVLLAAQMQATQNSQATCQAAQAELSQLGQTVRILFGADETVLTALGLRSRRRSAAGATADPAAGPDNYNNSYWSQGNLAEKIARWRRLLTNLQSLAATQQGELAQFGWGAERLAAANALVEACAAAHTGQKQKIQAYRAAAAAAQMAEVTAREWYQQATRRARLALQQVDPDNQTHLRDLLGL